MSRTLRGAEVLATDLDRTFSTLDLRPDPGALQAAARLRRAGTACILATGRDAQALAAWPSVLEAFDGFVLEEGAVWGTPGRWRVHCEGAARIHAIAQELGEAGVEVRRGLASLSLARQDAPELSRIPAASGCSVHSNHDRIDVVPKGVDKGVAVRALLREWGRPGAKVVGVGDGENDLGLFAASDYAVAVANAVPRLQAAADEVAPHPAARGFAWLVEERLLARKGA